ncbi:MAG: hypothetical protein Q8L48_19870 [Archangium sp.]|nr:hypothetical protein [Archangium sp.]
MRAWLIIGSIVGAMLLRPRRTFFTSARWWAGWRWGIRTSDLSSDLLSVTIHTRSAALRRELVALRL